MNALCEQFDSVRLNFSETSLMFLDISLAIIMFGVALNLKVEDFQRVIKQPKAPLIGVLSQFLILPALTLGFVLILGALGDAGWGVFCPSMALGMFLVAACPGGNVSNFISLLAKGNVALSVSLSAIATLGAIVMTPINFLFWSQWYEPAASILREIDMDPVSIFVKILLILAIPLAIGMLTASRFPGFTAKITKPIRILSIVIFGGYIIGALAGNWDFVVTYVKYVILIVFFHNIIALSCGYFLGSLGKLPRADRRSIAIETGIQNSGLGLVLIFGPVFDGMGGMAMVAAMWGIWHLISGISLASVWSRISVN
ncbi:MAG: bile acid:sodium symporter family protein [Bacteroidota bacterium]